MAPRLWLRGGEAVHVRELHLQPVRLQGGLQKIRCRRDLYLWSIIFFILKPVSQEGEKMRMPDHRHDLGWARILCYQMMNNRQGNCGKDLCKFKQTILEDKLWHTNVVFFFSFLHSDASRCCVQSNVDANHLFLSLSFFFLLSLGMFMSHTHCSTKTRKVLGNPGFPKSQQS